MRSEKISNRQFMYILFIMRTTVIIATLPVLTTGNALQDAWITAFFTLVTTSILVMLITGLGARFPEHTVVEYAQQLLGKWPGKALALLILWAYLHLAALSLRGYGEMIVTGFLTETPLLFVLGTMVVTAVYAAHLGIEVIGRLADIFLFIMLTAILLGLLAVAPEIRWANFEPVLARGLGPPMLASLVPVAFSAEVLVAGMLIPSLTEPRKAVASALWAAVLAGLALVTVAVVAIGVLGAELTSQTVFPLLRVVRAIQVTEFIDRIEILTIFSWGLGMFIGLATFIFCGGQGVTQLFGISNYRPLLPPMGIQWTILGFHVYQDMFEAREFFQPHFMGLYGIGLVLIPYAILWMVYVVKEGQQ